MCIMLDDTHSGSLDRCCHLLRHGSLTSKTSLLDDVNKMGIDNVSRSRTAASAV